MDEPTFRVRMFGPMEVHIDGHPLPRLRSRKALWLLALLILREGRSVQREWLSTILWPDTEQSAALANLRTILSELRAALGSEGQRLRSFDRHSVSFDLDGTDIDVARFDQAIKKGSPAALMTAVEMYRSSLLEGCGEEWVHQERVGRERDCLQALEKLAVVALRDGDFPCAEKWYRRATVIDPWWDGARRGLMESLAKQGNVNEALQVYRSFDALLRSDSASVPDKQTTALYLRMRTEARQLDTVVASNGPQVSPARVNGRLSHPITELVGREDERIEVASLLRSSRLVTLTGFGGIGKTRLAVDVVTDIVREYPDGVWLIPLDSITVARHVPKQLVLSLGLSERPERSSLEVLCEHLRERHLLIVLDNCEHLIDSVAEVCASLLSECRGVKLLTTSREALGITGETAWLVPSLAVPDPEHLPKGEATMVRVMMAYDGVRLFVERAQAVRKDFRITAENALLVAKICAALEGIPLAIEIAAARTSAMSLQRMFDRLYELVGEPGLPARGIAPRHKTLHTIVDWSHELLGEAERSLLRRLSIFAGGWTLEATTEVCADEVESDSTLDCLTALVQKSLAVFDHNPVESGERYRLLEGVRQYAESKLRESGELDFVARKHLIWCIRLAEDATEHFAGPAAAIWIARFEAERGNFRKALEYAMSAPENYALAQRFVASLWRFWHIQGNCREGLTYTIRALDCGEAEPRIRSLLLLAKGTLNYRGGNPSGAMQRLQEALALAMEIDDKAVAAEAAYLLGCVASGQLENTAALAFFDQSIELAEEVRDLKTAAAARLRRGLCELRETKQPYEAHRTLLERAIAEFEKLEDLPSRMWALDKLSNLAMFHGDHKLAKSIIEERLRANEKIGDKVRIAWSVFQLGTVAESQADYRVANARYEESLQMFKDHVGNRGTAWALLGLGNVAIDQKEYSGAEKFFTECLQLFEGLNDTWGVSHTLIGLATIERMRGSYSKSHEFLSRCLMSTKEMAESHAAGEALCEMAALSAETGENKKAATLFGAANSVRVRLGQSLYPQDQVRLESEISSLRKKLEEETFIASWERGEAMNWPEAIAYATAQSVPT